MYGNFSRGAHFKLGRPGRKEGGHFFPRFRPPCSSVTSSTGLLFQTLHLEQPPLSARAVDLVLVPHIVREILRLRAMQSAVTARAQAVWQCVTQITRGRAWLKSTSVSRAEDTNVRSFFPRARLLSRGNAGRPFYSPPLSQQNSTEQHESLTVSLFYILEIKTTMQQDAERETRPSFFVYRVFIATTEPKPIDDNYNRPPRHPSRIPSPFTA